MKTFKDFQFVPHPTGPGLSGKLFFPNGYGISCVRFLMYDGRYGSYTANEQQWECAILKGTAEKWDICYTTPLGDDMFGWLIESGVNDLMAQIQELPNVT